MVSVYLAMAVSIAGPIAVLSVVTMSEKKNRSTITVYSALLRDRQRKLQVVHSMRRMSGIHLQYFSTRGKQCGSEMCVLVGGCLPTWKDDSSRTWILFPVGTTRLSKSSSNFLQTVKSHHSPDTGYIWPLTVKMAHKLLSPKYT